MAAYHVILQIECDRNTILRQLGKAYLDELKQDAEGADYLASYVEHELGWAEHSFERIQVIEIKRIRSSAKAKRGKKS